MRLIDADELLKKKVLVYSCFNDEAEGILVKDIEETLTIDPEDLRPKGSWEFGVKRGASGYWCSNCESGFTGENAEWIAKEHDYCPKCGARMEE